MNLEETKKKHFDGLTEEGKRELNMFGHIVEQEIDSMARMELDIEQNENQVPFTENLFFHRNIDTTKIIEVSKPRYQCPLCGCLYESVEKLMEDMKLEIDWQRKWENFDFKTGYVKISHEKNSPNARWGVTKPLPENPQWTDWEFERADVRFSCKSKCGTMLCINGHYANSSSRLEPATEQDYTDEQKARKAHFLGRIQKSKEQVNKIEKMILPAFADKPQIDLFTRK